MNASVGCSNCITDMSSKYSLAIGECEDMLPQESVDFRLSESASGTF